MGPLIESKLEAILVNFVEKQAVAESPRLEASSSVSPRYPNS